MNFQGDLVGGTEFSAYIIRKDTSEDGLPSMPIHLVMYKISSVELIPGGNLARQIVISDPKASFRLHLEDLKGYFAPKRGSNVTFDFDSELKRV